MAPASDHGVVKKTSCVTQIFSRCFQPAKRPCEPQNKTSKTADNQPLSPNDAVVPLARSCDTTSPVRQRTEWFPEIQRRDTVVTLTATKASPPRARAQPNRSGQGAWMPTSAASVSTSAFPPSRSLPSSLIPTGNGRQKHETRFFCPPIFLSPPQSRPSARAQPDRSG